MYPFDVDPLKVTWRKGDAESPFQDKKESLKIVNNVIMLTEIPSEHHHVQINGYSESQNPTPSSNQYKVDYQQGIVYFNSSESGKTVVVSYKGKGIIQFPGNRVYVHDENNPSVTQTIQELSDASHLMVEATANLNGIKADFMLKSVYDNDGSGTVDDSERVGGQTLANLDNRYASMTDFTTNPKLGYENTSLTTWKKRFETQYVNVMDFGVVGDGIVDDTQAIISAITATPIGGTLYFPSGNYFVSKTARYTITWNSTIRSYCFLVDKNINIKGTSKTVITTSVADVADAKDLVSVFILNGVQDVKVEGLSFVGTGTTGTRLLYSGAGILMDSCKNVIVRNIKSTDMRSCIFTFNGEGNIIEQVLSMNSTYANRLMHIGVYSEKDTVVRECKTYGGCEDSNIGIFGGGANNCLITNCYTHNYLYGDVTKTICNTNDQGIGVDSGAMNSRIIDNYVYGSFYGIDVKSETEGIIVSGNVVEKCKCSIAARMGEANKNALLTQITNNVITPNGGNGHTYDFISGKSIVNVGILVDKAYGVLIEGNQIYNSNKLNTKANFTHILVIHNADITDFYGSPLSIVNNKFSQQSAFAGFNGYTTTYCIYIYNNASSLLRNVQINGNQFDLYYNPLDNPVIHIEDVFNLQINGNIFSTARGQYIFEIDGCQGLSMVGNSFANHHGIATIISTEGVNISTNTMLQGLDNTKSTIKLTSCTNSAINSNVYSYIGSGGTDSFFIEAVTSNWISAVGNMLEIGSKGSSDWYSLDGSATNINIASNLVS